MKKIVPIFLFALSYFLTQSISASIFTGHNGFYFGKKDTCPRAKNSASLEQTAIDTLTQTTKQRMTDRVKNILKKILQENPNIYEERFYELPGIEK